MAKQSKYHLAVEIDKLTNSISNVISGDSFPTNLNQKTMGYIKEPSGIDFVVDPTSLTVADKKKISEIIAYYKTTGKKMPFSKTTKKQRLTNSKK